MSTTINTMPSGNINDIDLTWSVNAFILRYPDALPVFAAYGLDTCCRGALSVHDAALDAGVDPAMIVAALRETVTTNSPCITPLESTTPRSSCGCAL